MQFVFVDGGPVEVEFLTFIPQRATLFEDVDFGAGGDVLVSVHWLSPGPRTLLSVSIAGVFGNLIATASGSTGGSATASVALVSANISSGTIGDVLVTLSGSMDGCAIGVYRSPNLTAAASSSTPGQLGWNSSSTNIRTTSADVEAGGLFLVASSVFHDGGSTLLSGVVNSYDYDYDSANVFHTNGGFAVVDAAVAGKTATVTKSGGAENMYGSLIAVPLR